MEPVKLAVVETVLTSVLLTVDDFDIDAEVEADVASVELPVLERDNVKEVVTVVVAVLESDALPEVLPEVDLLAL